MPIIKHEDVIKKGNPVDELTKSLEDLIKVEDKLIAKNKETAESFNLIKKSNDGAEAQKLIETTNKLKKETEGLTDVQKERLKLLDRLKTANSDNIQKNEELKVQLTKQRKVNKDLAKDTLGLTSAYDKQSRKLNELRKKYKDLAVQNKANTKEGRALLANITKLDTQLKKVDNSVGQNQRSVGKYTNALKGLGTQLLGGLGVTAAIGFLKDQFNKASERADILNKSTNRLKGTFNITTSTAQKLAGQINAISTTFEDADSKNIEIALSAIVGSFKDISESDALNLIEEGFKKGSNNSGEFLDILKEYPVQFKAAGIDARTMFAIINQQVKQGIYSDKGVDTIKEAGLRLRENTKAVKEALRPLDESIRKQIEQEIAAGNSFKAIQLVSEALKDTSLTAEETQAIIADVFGGAGEDAGIEYIKTLSEIETNLKGVATQTTVNQDVNLELAKSYNKFVSVVGDSEGFLASFFAGVKFKLSEMLDSFAEFFKETKGLKILRRETDENEKSTRRLTTAEKKLIKEEEKAELNRIKWEAGADARRKKREKAAADEVKRIKKISDAADKAEAKRRAKDLDGIGDPVKGISFNDEIEADNKIHLDKLLAQDKNYFDKKKILSKEAEGAILQIKNAAIAAAGQILADSISFGIDAQTDAAVTANEEEQARNEESAEADKEILSQNLESGLITEKEFKEESAKIDEDLRAKNEKLEKDSKKQIAIADKKKALFDIGIATAVAIARVIPNPIAMALAATLGALQLAVVAAKPIPKFAEGEINIKGKSHSQGGILAEIEGRESIINTTGTANAPKMLNDINNGLFKDSDIDMMKNNDHYSYNMLQLNGLVDEMRVNGSLTKETNKLLSKVPYTYDRGNLLIVKDIYGNVIESYIKDKN